MSISIRTTPQKMFPLLVPSVAESATCTSHTVPRPFIVFTMPAKPSLAALEKQFETERVRTKVLELWREGNLSINDIAKHKDVAKAKMGPLPLPHGKRERKIWGSYKYLCSLL